ncbi:hypothetical protein [Pseudomonas sp. PSKL.D1]|uniref:hypothetical protein n=1 Tax=Pseudomonas sp. PSKL.D1 TaxID=3029060 RepID=UPI0023815086|nr:hypothetical protein [Pseudomonas sp. PSKL.D1]WDY55961.1 hypothetical protein PVV54_15260 [Pseudomonas sp. PSKL.D1]
MNFLDLIGKGIEKSNTSKAASREVELVFKELNTQLQEFRPFPLKLYRSTSTMQNLALTLGKLHNAEHEYLPEDQLHLSAELYENTFAIETVAGWRQHIDGYPCTLKFSGQEISCFNKKELLSAISELLTSISFGNAVNNLIERSKNKKSETPPPHDSAPTPNKKTAKKPTRKKPEDHSPSM